MKSTSHNVIDVFEYPSRERKQLAINCFCCWISPSSMKMKKFCLDELLKVFLSFGDVKRSDITCLLLSILLLLADASSVS